LAVVIQNYGFNPSTATIKVGTTVTWTNFDSSQHQISNAAMGNYGPGQLFESAPLGNGGTYSFIFTKTDSFPYYCTIHPYIGGYITVTS